MIHRRYIDDTHRKIEKLLDEMEAMEIEVYEVRKENLRLKDIIKSMEEITARDCLGGDIAKGMDSDVPPEKRPPLKAAKRRIKAAINMFTTHFDNSGNPTTEFGTKLSKKYHY